MSRTIVTDMGVYWRPVLNRCLLWSEYLHLPTINTEHTLVAPLPRNSTPAVSIRPHTCSSLRERRYRLRQ
jgi:hypothetical protein